MSTMLGKYLNTREAAELIGCTDATVRRMLIDGKLKGEKLGERAWAIPIKEAERAAANPSIVGRPRKNKSI